MVKALPANAGDARDASSLGWEDLSEGEMATHSSTLAWIEKPHRLQPMGSQRARHDSEKGREGQNGQRGDSEGHLHTIHKG